MHKEGYIRAWRAMLVVFIFAVVSEEVFAEITNLADAINKAGRQRMLTQRMLKSYSMAGLYVQPAEAQKQLNDAVALFEKQLAELKNYSPNTATKKALQRVTELWRPFRKSITGPVNPEAARQMLKPNDALLVAADQVVKQLEKLSTTSQGRLVNLSGRQRMLSQRLAKFYMLRAWGVDSAEIHAEEKKAAEAFRRAMDELVAAKENTAAISQALDKARMQWDLLKHALDRKGENFIPLIVAMSSENLLKTMNQITGMYAELSQ